MNGDPMVTMMTSSTLMTTHKAVMMIVILVTMARGNEDYGNTHEGGNFDSMIRVMIRVMI